MCASYYSLKNPAESLIVSLKYVNEYNYEIVSYKKLYVYNNFSKFNCSIFFKHLFIYNIVYSIFYN